MVVDDGVVVVGDFGVCDWAASLWVAGIVMGVVGWEDGGGGSYHRADLLGRHDYGRVVVECSGQECSGVGQLLKNCVSSVFRMKYEYSKETGTRNQGTKETYRSYSGHLEYLVVRLQIKHHKLCDPAPALLILLTTRVSELSRSHDWLYAVKLSPLLPVQNLSR